MRIAISADTDDGLKSRVGHHLGRSPYFALIDLEGEEIKQVQIMPNPYAVHHEHGAVASFIEAQGAEVMISGGMGRHANAYFEERGIGRATGASGTVQDAVGKYLAGELSGYEPCEDHDHHDHHDHHEHHEHHEEH